MKKKTQLIKQIEPENKLSRESLLLIEDLLKKESHELNVFRQLVTGVMHSVAIEEKLKIYQNINAREAELGKACREIHLVFDGQIERNRQ